MTSKEASLSLYKQVDKCANKGEFNLVEAWNCYKIVMKDLDRLEKLEKVIEVLRDKIIIYQFDSVIDNSVFYTLETDHTNKTISKEECELLRELLYPSKNM